MSFKQFLAGQLYKLLSDKITSNTLNQALYKYMNNRAPIYSPDNPDSYITNAYCSNINMYSIIRKIADKGKTIPVELWAGGEKIETHEILDRLKQPNPLLSWSEFFEGYTIFKRITGNCFIWMNRIENGVNAGMPLEMWFMPPGQTEIIGGSNWNTLISAYGIRGSNLTFKSEDVIHIKYFNPEFDGTLSSLYGLSPIKAANRAVTQDNDSFKAMVSMYQNMGTTGILTADGDAFALQEEEASALKAKLNIGKGAEHYREIHFTNYPLKWTQIGLDAVDLSIIDSRKMNVRDLCNCQNFPSQCMNDNEGSKYDNMQQARMAVITDCVEPDMDELLSALNKQFIAPYSKRDGKKYELKYNLNCFEEIRQNRINTLKAIDALQILTINEKRELAEYSPVDDEYANEIIINNNQKRLADIEMSEVAVDKGGKV